jgi:hypothetical protein
MPATFSDLVDSRVLTRGCPRNSIPRRTQISVSASHRRLSAGLLISRRNMNRESIARLSTDDLRIVSEVAGETLIHFGYELLAPR